MEDAEGVAVGRSGRGGWETTAGLLSGVLAADDTALSKFIAPRPASAVKGDGVDFDASGSPESGGSRARCFPFLTSALPSSAFSNSLIRNARIYSADNVWRSVFPVAGFLGIRLHFDFFVLHRPHTLSGSTSQWTPNFLHASHCHCLLASRKLRGWRPA